ncbi:hypothetical protein IFM89_004287, partial [Coptis chinensis]
MSSCLHQETGQHVLLKLMHGWRLMDELGVLRAIYLLGSGQQRAQDVQGQATTNSGGARKFIQVEVLGDNVACGNLQKTAVATDDNGSALMDVDMSSQSHDLFLGEGMHINLEDSQATGDGVGGYNTDALIEKNNAKAVIWGEISIAIEEIEELNEDKKVAAMGLFASGDEDLK